MSGPPSTFPPLSSRFDRITRDSSSTIRTDRPTLQPMSIASLMQLETPHAVVDCARMHQNIDKVAQYVRQSRINLRPHVKTHKDPEVAKVQLEAGAIGLTVATAREAEVMSSVCKDILVAFPPVDPARIDRLLALPPDITLTLAIDSAESLKRLEESALRRGFARRIRILVEVDVGAGRTGLSDTKEVCRLAREVADGKNTEFWGLMAFFGHIRKPPRDPGLPQRVDAPQDESTTPKLRAVSEKLRLHIRALLEAGLSCPIVSGGSTPSLIGAELVPELTEVRPGTYAYADRDIASQGVLDWEDCAYSVLSTVISTAVPGQAVIDAGTKALAREPIAGLEGYGALMDCPEAIVKELHEEHGIVDLSRTDWRPKVGDRVRVIPNHVCVSVHLQDQVAFAETGELTLRDVMARGR